ncbi:MAG: GDP-mannose 4,6-dehydratase [Anaerolineae bacterium]|jgi:GDP-4-dehydro-6-deoxy-D-mannose reductase|nr:GDP-mannose 4,6-dehydratase [Anaerolineae bacterium]
MRVLITGASGFVGTHLRHHLLAETDWEIVGTTFPEPPPTPAGDSRDRLLALDLTDADSTRALLDAERPDLIVHLAAQSHVPTAYRDPWGTLRNNVLGQLNLLESCVSTEQHPRILVIGSGEEYGRAAASALPLTEDHPLRPENPYSVSKVTQDVMGYQYFISHRLPIVRVRPFNHIGPGQSTRFVLPAFASQVAEIEAGKHAPVIDVGNLAPARDFTDVRDVVEAYRLALLHGIAGEVYNVASGRGVTIQSLLDQLIACTDTEIEVRIDAKRYRPADIPIIYGSSARLHLDTGWLPRIPIEQTVEDVLREWRDRHGVTGSAPQSA